MPEHDNFFNILLIRVKMLRRKNNKLVVRKYSIFSLSDWSFNDIQCCAHVGESTLIITIYGDISKGMHFENIR